MDDITEKIKIPSNELRLESIQELLLKVRTHRSSQNAAKWSELLQLLWAHIETNLPKLDDQLLCATCFYTILEITNEKENYLNKVSALITQELELRVTNNEDTSKELSSFIVSHEKKNRKILQVVSLMYGLLQSTFVTNTIKDIIELAGTLKSSMDLLIAMAYEYSRYTFIVFKTISSLKKVCGTELQEIVFSHSNFIRLLNLVNHNWENPITGVRDLNKSIFQILVSLNENFSKMILKEINNFYWNKAKFLMLSEIIEQSKEKLVNFVLENNWIDGLIYSLSKPGLVSAGADMYYAIIKNLNTEEEWCTLFKDRIIYVLNGEHNKSIDNFCNYWCLGTFKKFPDLPFILIGELQNFEESESKLYSGLCILKQANKLGLLAKTWDTNEYGIVEKMILAGTEHCNPYTRMLQFEIVCVKQGKALPSSTEFNLILNYLSNNVNSDCTVLRISMLRQIKCFLTYLHASYYNHTKNHQKFEAKDLMNFYKSLQEFIIESLNLDGNYQRKVATIKLCGILLSSLNETPKKRQKEIINSGVEMTKFLKQHDCFLLFQEINLVKLFSLLKDPAEDIREITVQLLLNHYSQQITPDSLDCLIKDAQDCIKSKFFYQICCGQSIFRLITSLLLKENYTDTVFKSVEDVFVFAFDVLNKEYELKRDIVKSIEDGKQLHAYLSILLEVLKVAKQNSYEVKNLRELIPQLLNILEDISNQFAWEQEPATSSDFSKMSDMVKSIIASSGYNPQDENDLAKITGLQQIVLNCLWLNVKASCDLASYLTQLFRNEDAAACGRCLTIITHVLETSRHKGAIEAAGAALGRAIQNLTSLPEDSALSLLPLSLLKCKLTELISSAAMASVTRRGAGLSIMVHRIVSSDMKKGKPLFHHFMGTLLQVCHEIQSPAGDDGCKDVPEAIYIHFLTRVVMDSGLASDTMFYAAELAAVAFDNLTSTHWQIRNAALQLYGALIPKLIGQKKASGSDDETVATVACDEFRTHSPQLWRRMVLCLTTIDATNQVQSHSNLMPILNVLANLARRYNFQSDTSDEKELLLPLMALLGSPIYTVRRLTAKSIFNIFQFESIHDIVMKQENVTENFLHGSLLLVGNYMKYSSNLNSAKFNQLKDKFKKILDKENHSYVSKREFDELWSHEYIKGEVKDVVEEAKRNRYSPGVFHWANSKIKRHIEVCPWEDIPDVLKILLQESDYENYCEFILIKMETNNDIPRQILLEIGKILEAFPNKFKSCVIWKIFYFISTGVDLGDAIDTVSIFNYLETSGVSYRTRYILPFLSSLCGKLPENHLIRLAIIIFSLCDPDTSDVDMRYIASLANNEVAKAFSNIPDSVRITSIKCAYVLLQDEDEDVRMLNIKFYSNIKKDNNLLHPYVCWMKILEKSFLQEILDNPETGINTIHEELSEVVASYAKSNVIDEYNPFANDSKNIYFELQVVRQQLQKLK
ncbi:uncharacterized protein LOC114351038 [Ostrinia furnacalis]|uniref:uncharacterized protein LOC114351038 n=1 Tax=Ostrinia furnacalis TaxID=93504 RepID=UPI00103BD3B5|nr:uncharacterized protein LOC114351038 [Ostrinia furnacalis]XP_028157878.1 uncharacterized protein LOC114351038 [Ostrinia furnacalis]